MYITNQLNNISTYAQPCTYFLERLDHGADVHPPRMSE